MPQDNQDLPEQDQPSAQQLLSEFLQENNINLRVSSEFEIEQTDTGKLLISPPQQILVSYTDAD